MMSVSGFDWLDDVDDWLGGVVDDEDVAELLGPGEYPRFGAWHIDDGDDTTTITSGVQPRLSVIGG